MPPLMSTHGCYIGSLGSLCRCLGEQARPRVEIYPGISVTDAMIGPNGEVEGVITATWVSRATARTRTATRQASRLPANYTLLAEGARGSLTKQLNPPLQSRCRERAAKYASG